MNEKSSMIASYGALRLSRLGIRTGCIQWQSVARPVYSTGIGIFVGIRPVFVFSLLRGAAECDTMKKRHPATDSGKAEI
jgi:hypothetical protein